MLYQIKSDSDELTLENELTILHEWMNKLLVTFHTDKCSVLSVDKNFPENNHTLSNKVHGHSSNERDLGVAQKSLSYCQKSN